MPTCEADGCDAEVETKNSAGHYRDKCWECIEAAAERDLSNNPYHGDDSI